MGGTAVSTGAENQASVAAYVATRMLLEWPLNWSSTSGDVPIAIEGEVSGPGDDHRVYLRGGRPPLEVQCKRTLAGKTALFTALRDIESKMRSVPANREVILVVGSGTSVDVRDVFATDVRNFRQGRREGLRQITKSVLAEVTSAEVVLSRLVVVTLDVDDDSSSGSQFALDGLRHALTEPDRAEQAWGILIRHALRLARRGRWDRGGVERLLIENKFTLRPVGGDARWLEQIDYARKLHQAWRQKTAAGLLDHVADELRGQAVAPEVRRQLHTVRGVVALLLGEPATAHDHFARALEYAVAPTSAPTPMTPEQLKRWLDARYHYGLTLHLRGNHGDNEAAETIARDILAHDDRHVSGWMLLAYTLDRRGAQPELPPWDLRNTPEYRDALAQIAASRGEWRAAVEARAPSIAAGHHHPLRLIEHAHALINLTTEPLSGEERTRLIEQTERVAGDAIRILENSELEAQLARAFFLRGRARETLGSIADADRDYARATTLAPTDPNVVVRAVQLRRRSGDRGGVLALLTDEAVEDAPLLRTLRAEERFAGGDNDGATADLRRALDALPAVATGAEMGLYLDIAALAIDLGQLTEAERALAAIDAAGLSTQNPEPGIIRGRIAIAREQWETAEQHYRAAAAVASGEDARRVLAEFATRLATNRRMDRAIALYREAGADTPSHSSFVNYVTALVHAERFDEIVTLFERHHRAAAAAGQAITTLPDRLLEAAMDVAWRREDFRTAAQLIRARMEQESGTGRPVPIRLLIAGAQAYANLDDQPESQALVDEALARPDLQSEDRMRAAHVLNKLGAHQRAIDVAFTAVRARPSEKQMIASFLNVVVMPTVRPARQQSRTTGHADAAAGLPEAPVADAAIDGVSTPGETATSAERERTSAAPSAGSSGLSGDDATSPPRSASTGMNAAETRGEATDDDDVGDEGREGVVAPDCFVRLRSNDGQRYDYFIYRDPPTEPRLSEFLATDAAVADLIGKRVGDVIVRNRGTWGEQRLQVSRVLPAVVMVFRRYIRTFAVQFPDELSFRVFNVGKSPTAESLAPIVASLYQSATHSQDVIARYATTPLPLGAVAHMLGKPLVDVIGLLASRPEYRLHVDGPPFTKYDDGVQAALSPTTIVLTRSALVFLDALGLWDALVARARLIAPHSMMLEWEQEIHELQTTNDNGRIFLRELGARPVADDIPPGTVGSALNRSRDLFNRVKSMAAILHRPASALTATDEEWRERLGAPSADALALARAEQGVVYADDLGLRYFAQNEFGVGSFPTSALLDVLHSDGRLTDEEFERAIVRLIEWGHDMVPIRAGTIVAAFGSAGTSFRTAERVLARLGDPRVEAIGATVISVQALRRMAISGVLSTTLDDAAEQVVAALVHHRDSSDVIPYFDTAVQQAFRLLPTHQNAVLAAVRRAIEAKRTMRNPDNS